MRAIRAVGHVSWWVFVVGAVIAQLTSNTLWLWPGGSSSFGWTAYTPQTNGVLYQGDYGPVGGDQPSSVVAVVALLALVVTIAAAVIEAYRGGHWSSGVVTVLAPIVGAVFVLFNVVGSVIGAQFFTHIAFALVLIGVAIREVWSRGFAPTRLTTDSRNSG